MSTNHLLKTDQASIQTKSLAAIRGVPTNNDVPTRDTKLLSTTHPCGRNRIQGAAIQIQIVGIACQTATAISAAVDPLGPGSIVAPPDRTLAGAGDAGAGFAGDAAETG